MNAVRSIFLAASMVTGLVHPLQAQALSIEETEFWVYLNDDQGNEVSFQSNVVPLVPDRTCYGWRLRLGGIEGLVKFKEVFSLPAAPETWELADGEFSTSSITGNRRTSVTEKFAAFEDGWIGNSWCVVEGDPEGAYSMEVYVNGQFIERFDFEVREARPD